MEKGVLLLSSFKVCKACTFFFVLCPSTLILLSNEPCVFFRQFPSLFNRKLFFFPSKTERACENKSRNIGTINSAVACEHLHCVFPSPFFGEEKKRCRPH